MTTTPESNGSVLTFADLDVLEESNLSQAELNEAMTRGDATIGLRKGTQKWEEIIYNLKQQDLPSG